MNTVLTDSMAREHVQSMQAVAAASVRAREVRTARRAARRAARAAARTDGQQHRTRRAFGRAASRPFAAAHHWLAAGQL